MLAEMVSPLDLKKACLSFDKLGLPLRLRKLKSGVTVVESAMASAEQVDERMKAAVADKGEETFGLFGQYLVVRNRLLARLIACNQLLLIQSLIAGLYTCAEQGVSVEELANAASISLYVAKEQLEVYALFSN
jgi:hypothetical protein|eukprot:COSAG02_NODE_826_length_16718_cov_4813.219628_11_plen_133_part_00